jgi:hypothetical protein
MTEKLCPKFNDRNSTSTCRGRSTMEDLLVSKSDIDDQNLLLATIH